MPARRRAGITSLASNPRMAPVSSGPAYFRIIIYKSRKLVRATRLVESASPRWPSPILNMKNQFKRKLIAIEKMLTIIGR